MDLNACLDYAKSKKFQTWNKQEPLLTTVIVFRNGYLCEIADHQTVTERIYATVSVAREMLSADAVLIINDSYILCRELATSMTSLLVARATNTIPRMVEAKHSVHYRVGCNTQQPNQVIQQLIGEKLLQECLSYLYVTQKQQQNIVVPYETTSNELVWKETINSLQGNFSLYGKIMEDIDKNESDLMDVTEAAAYFGLDLAEAQRIADEAACEFLAEQGFQVTRHSVN